MYGSDSDLAIIVSRVCAIAADALVLATSWFFSFEFHRRTGLGFLCWATGASLTKVLLRDGTAGP